MSGDGNRSALNDLSAEQLHWLELARPCELPPDFGLGVVKVNSPGGFGTLGALLAAASYDLAGEYLRLKVENRPGGWQRATPELPELCMLVASPRLGPDVIPDGYVLGAWLVAGEQVQDGHAKPVLETGKRADALWRHLVGTIAPIKGNWLRVTEHPQ